MDVLDKLAEQYGGYWDGEHPDFTVSSWKYLVANGDTRLGYWAWVQCCLEDPE